MAVGLGSGVDEGVALGTRVTVDVGLGLGWNVALGGRLAVGLTAASGLLAVRPQAATMSEPAARALTLLINLRLDRYKDSGVISDGAIFTMDLPC